MARYTSRSNSDAQAVGAILLIFVYAAAAVGFLLGPILAAIGTLLLNFVAGILSVFMIMGRRAPHVGKTIHGTFFRTVLLTLFLTVLTAGLSIWARTFYPHLVEMLSEMSEAEIDWDWVDQLFEDPITRNPELAATSLVGDISDFAGRIFPGLLLSGYMGMVPRLNWFIRTATSASGSVAIFAVYELYAPQWRDSIERAYALPPGILTPEGATPLGSSPAIPFNWPNLTDAVMAAFASKAEAVLNAVQPSLNYLRASAPKETALEYLSGLIASTRGNLYAFTRELDFGYFVLAVFAGSGATLTLPAWLASLFKVAEAPSPAKAA